MTGLQSSNGRKRRQALLKEGCVFCVCLVVFAALGGVSPEIDESQIVQHVKKVPATKIPSLSKMSMGTVVRVLDGDTLIIDAHDTTLRYQVLGADAPEVTPKSRKQIAFSHESKQFLEQLLLGEQVYIQYDPLGKRDGSKRWTAYLFRAPDMLFVNLELIRQGYAKHDSKRASVHHDVLVYYETRAKDFKRGIWNPDLPELSEQDFEPELNLKPKVETNPESKPEESPKRNSNAPGPNSLMENQVYITKYGKKYHRHSCPHLTKGGKRIEREDLDESLSPCKTCRPDGQ